MVVKIGNWTLRVFVSTQSLPHGMTHVNNGVYVGADRYSRKTGCMPSVLGRSCKPIRVQCELRKLN